MARQTATRTEGAGRLAPELGESAVNALQSLAGGVFLYCGLRAVHLTEMANRAWKRAADYGLIVAERWRLDAAGAVDDRPDPRAASAGNAAPLQG